LFLTTILSSFSTLADCPVFRVHYISFIFLPTRQTIVDSWRITNAVSYYEIAIVLITLAANSFIFGWMSRQIISMCQGKNPSLTNSLNGILSWFPRSLVATTIGWLGILIINLLLIPVASDSVHSFLLVLFSGCWTTLTFTFYPTLIADESSLLRGVIKSFSVSLYSVRYWFHLYLAVFFISGGVTFLWLPEYWANSLLGVSHDYAGWMVHFQWLGGYSFHSYWYSDLSSWLFANPSIIITSAIMVFNVLVATFVKIRVTQILHEKGLLSNLSTVEFEEQWSKFKFSEN
jgi:hypothetical protein